MAAEITDIMAREILDLRGNPTVEVEVWLDDGAQGRARCLPARPRACMRRWSYAMAIRVVMAARGY